MTKLIRMENISEDTINTNSYVSLSKEDLFRVWDKCNEVKNSAIRSRMVSNLYVAKAAHMILANLGVNSNTLFSLQEVFSILSKIDIAELYANDCRVSVRCNFDNYKLFIPKKHEKYSLLGDLFMFVRFEDNKVKLLGFLPLEDLNKDNSDDDNFYVELEELKSFEEIKGCLHRKMPIENIENAKLERAKIIQYFDGSLDDKISFFKQVSASKYLREEMIKYENAQKFYLTVIQKEELIQKEFEKDVEKISKLADVFIQAKEEVLKHPETMETADNFKLECARANLEKLFNDAPVESDIELIQNQTKEEVMDSLLTQTQSIDMQDDRLPMTALLDAFKVFGLLFMIMLVTAGIFCFAKYDEYSMSPRIQVIKPTIKHQLIRGYEWSLHKIENSPFSNFFSSSIVKKK